MDLTGVAPDMTLMRPKLEKKKRDPRFRGDDG
jgi:hypothetical protein